jgi:hypothetical protein
MTIRLVKKKDQKRLARKAEKKQEEKRKPDNPSSLAQRWVDEYKARKEAEIARIRTTLGHEAA